MNIAAGIITQLKMALGTDVTSVIPIKAEMTVNQILLLNFAVVITVMALISIVTTYLAADVPYSPLEILQNCAFIFMVIPLLIFAAAVFNAINADIPSDKIWIILSGAYYVFLNVINIGCILTVKYDTEE